LEAERSRWYCFEKILLESIFILWFQHILSLGRVSLSPSFAT
jgi:hypothetical protein